MNGIDGKLAHLLDRYVSLEKEIQKLVSKTAIHFCGRCRLICCKEEICKESVESAFLSMLVERQGLAYDPKHGWIRPKGCGLAYGRPLVCAEFFCDAILKSAQFKTAHIQEIIQRFVSVGNKAHGSTHLLCIDDLDVISPTKIEKMLSHIDALMDSICLHPDAEITGLV